MNRRIQGLWVGDALSAMERLSIASYLAHGHDFDLYAYGPIRDVPPGARLLDAAEVLPVDRVFLYRDRPSYAGFANYFRYKLLLERGGWWVDLDTVCLRPFDFEGDHVFSSERTRDGRSVPNATFLKAPAGSPVMGSLWDACRSKDPAAIIWGETGSKLLAETLPRLATGSCLQDPDVFCPIDFFEWRRALDPGDPRAFPESTRAVHLWHEMWRKEGSDKDAEYPPDCLYERLKARHGVGPSPRPEACGP
jgi:hypothetical protein